MILNNQEWEESQLASVVIIAGAGEKAFCAGGDVAALAKLNQEGKDGQASSGEYFGLEYQLDHLIATYQKPYIAYMDGITMGGGVGLSVHAPFRIATERTVFAMPETTIGFFPDVGGSFFLPRLDGQIGKYLALTSERLKGVNAFYAGVATHYIHSSSLGDLTARLSELVFKDYDSFPKRLASIDTTIEEFSTGLPHDEPMLLAGELREAIDRCFAPETIESLIANLEQEVRNNGSTAEWAKKTLATLTERSPTSLKVTMKQLELGKGWGIANAFRREHQIAKHFMAHPDFTEGVIARLVEKRAPQWNPKSLSDISDQNVERFLLTEGTVLELLSEGDYKDYPYPWLGLPSEREVQRLVQGKDIESAEQVIKWFVDNRNQKVGVREKVKEILSRRLSTVEKRVRWVTDADKREPFEHSRAS